MTEWIKIKNNLCIEKYHKTKGFRFAEITLQLVDEQYILNGVCIENIPNGMQIRKFVINEIIDKTEETKKLIELYKRWIDKRCF